MALKIFVVILNWNGKEFIRRCLDSVEEMRKENFEIEVVLVDNASTDGSTELIKTSYKKVIVLENKENLGFAEGNNVGIRYALKNGADYVLILNPDTFVDKDTLLQLIEAGKNDQKIGILGPKIYFAPGSEFHKKRYSKEDQGKVIWYAGGKIDWKNILSSHRGVDEVDKGQFDQMAETDFVSGCAMMVKKEVFEKIGLFDKNYFLYLEDNDFCQRAKKNGFKVVYAPKALVWHLNAGSSDVGGPLQDYFLTRNRMLFGLKFGSWRAKMALIKESLKLLFSGRSWQKIGTRDFYFQKFGKGSWL